MFETTRTYSEDQYIKKEELRKELSGVVLESVWQQIQEYRRIFRFTPYKEKPYYVTLNPYVIQKLSFVKGYFCNINNGIRNQHIHLH